MKNKIEILPRKLAMKTRLAALTALKSVRRLVSGCQPPIKWRKVNPPARLSWSPVVQSRVQARCTSLEGSTQAMLFSGESAQGIPFTQSFKTTADWQEIWMLLTDFNGADLANLRGLAWTAAAPEGEFKFWIDEVELR